MQHDRFVCLDGIKGVEREYRTIRLAADYLRRTAQDDPGLLGKEASVRDIDRASDHLEPTYVIRLFAEFETALRSFWATQKRSKPQTKALIDGIAARCRIPDEILTDAQAVRQFRNTLVHEVEREVQPMPIDLVRQRLCKYLGRLARFW